MTFKESIVTCFRYKYLNIQGRASRSEFWWFTLFCFIVNTVVGLIPFLNLLAFIVSIVLCIPQLCCMVRRLHDTNRSGIYVLAPLSCFIIGFIFLMLGILLTSNTLTMIAMFFLIASTIIYIILLIMLIMRGTDGPNNYGENPLAVKPQEKGAQQQ